MRTVIFYFILIFFVSCLCPKSAENTACCKSALTINKLTDYTARKLGKEYKTMKKKHLKCCDDFGSDFQKIMQALSEKLNKTGQDTNYIRTIMGAPDANIVPRQYGSFTSGNENIMVYWWRGWRDFLYCISENGKVKYVKWFNAYE